MLWNCLLKKTQQCHAYKEPVRKLPDRPKFKMVIRNLTFVYCLAATSRSFRGGREEEEYKECQPCIARQFRMVDGLNKDRILIQGTTICLQYQTKR